MYIVKKDNIVFNIDNNDDLKDILTSGGVQLTEEEIIKYDMKGYESIISPNNTVVNHDGTVVFTKPIIDLTKLKEEKIKQIDKETSESILAGFTYTIKYKERFFSYDSFDQQNFADAANTALLSQMQPNVKTIPTDVNWNSYVGEEKELEIITLDASEFLDLYVNGALVHKNTKMQIGGQRKSQVAEAQSKEDLDKI